MRTRRAGAFDELRPGALVLLVTVATSATATSSRDRRGAQRRRDHDPVRHGLDPARRLARGDGADAGLHAAQRRSTSARCGHIEAAPRRAAASAPRALTLRQLVAQAEPVDQHVPRRAAVVERAGAGGPRVGSRPARRRRWSGRWRGGSGPAAAAAPRRGAPSASPAARRASSGRGPARAARATSPARRRAGGHPARCRSRRPAPRLQLLDGERDRAAVAPGVGLAAIHHSASATVYGCGSRGSQRASSPDEQASTMAGTSAQRGRAQQHDTVARAPDRDREPHAVHARTLSRSGDTRRAGFRSVRALPIRTGCPSRSTPAPRWRCSAASSSGGCRSCCCSRCCT